MPTLSRQSRKFIREFHAFAATQTGPYQSYRTDTCALAQFMKHKYGKRATYLGDTLATITGRFFFNSAFEVRYPNLAYNAAVQPHNRTWEALTERLSWLLD